MAFILDDILLAPLNFVIWVGRQMSEEARRQLTDDSAIQSELYDLQMRRELEEISEEEYKAGETELLKKLEEINRYKEDLGE